MASNAIIGAPYQQVFSTGDSYRYNGEMSPEQALQEQALNRKQQIANLLIQRGLQQPQGQMAGRFYVAPSPVQHVAQLGQLAAGVFGNMTVDDSRKALSDQSKQDVAAALANFRTQTGPQTQSFEQFGPGEPVAKSLMEVDPYIQQVNANAQPSKQWDQQTIIDQGKNGAGTIEVPAEMNAALEIQRERQQRGPGFYSEGPRPTTDITSAATPEQRQQAIIDLLANQHPHVRALGAMLQQSDERKADKAETRAFMSEQKQLDRENRLATTEAQLNQALMLGLITKEQKDQLLAMQEQANRDRADHAKVQEGIQQGQLDLARQAEADRTANAKVSQEIQRGQLDLQRQQIEQGKTPPGYRRTVDGNLEAIPGGPADQKLQGQFNQDTSILQNSNAGFDRLATSANQLLNHPGIAGITGVRGKLPDVPGTDAADARALLNTLKSQVGFSVLQEMRNNSKTGGALGNVSDAEGKRLENNLAALDTAQSLDQFKRQLQEIIDYANGAKDRLREAFNMKHKGGQPMPMAPATNGPAVGTVESGYRFKGGDPSKPESWEKVN